MVNLCIYVCRPRKKESCRIRYHCFESQVMFFAQTEGDITSSTIFCVRTAKGRRTETKSATSGTISTTTKTKIEMFGDSVPIWSPQSFGKPKPFRFINQDLYIEALDHFPNSPFYCKLDVRITRV